MDEVAGKRPEDLPEFRNPPVTEVLAAVYFALEHKPLSLLETADFLNRACRMERDVSYSGAPRELPPGRGTGPGGLEVRSMPPLPRIWLVSKDGTRLLQFQQDRLVHNWRKVEENSVYPRFEAVRDEFLYRWRAFEDFVGEVRPNDDLTLFQAELCYVNHIPRGSIWNQPCELKSVFKFFAGCAAWKKLEDIPECAFRMEMKQCDGSLGIGIQPAVRKTDGKELIRFELTAKGRPPSSESLKQWLGGARIEIVNAFDGLTTGQAHEEWAQISGG